ncbi:alpha/beta fold hydrolase [Gordonia sinesedis]
MAATLRRTGRSVISFDLRGHGRSSHVPDYALADFAADAAAVLDNLDVARADIIGHSLGAHTALRLAMTRPDLVDSVVLEEVPPMPRDQADLDEQITVGSGLGERLRGIGWLLANPTPLFRFDRTLADRVSAQFDVADPDWWARLGDVTARTLVISGGERSFLPPRHLRALADTIDSASFAVIDAGHSVHRDRRREFEATVTDFLRQRP